MLSEVFESITVIGAHPTGGPAVNEATGGGGVTDIRQIYASWPAAFIV
jgi:hypothetical protein